MSLVGMAALGVALVLVTSAQMQRQAATDGITLARVVAGYAAGGVPSSAFVTGVLTDDVHAQVTAQTAGFSGALVELRLWSLDGRLMHSSDPTTTSGLPHAQRFDAVMGEGAPDAVVQRDVRRGAAGTAAETTVLDVYVPVQASQTADGGAGGAAAPRAQVGVAEVVLDHTANQRTLARAVRDVTLVVASSLVVLWLLLFRIVTSTSRRLRHTALENARLAMLDSLTGLPNRRLLADQMRRTIARAEVDGTRVGLILLDVDRFKDINDTLGHDHGDELLEQVAERLRGALRDDDVVARLGGDEFAILLPDVRTVANAERLGRRVRGLFARPFELGGMALHVETSIGVACLPDHAGDASALMRTADIAMYVAKHQRTGVAVYSPDVDDSSPARLVLLGELHAAIEAQAAGRSADLTGAPGSASEHAQLEMHYQPKIELASGRTVGFEALLRWRHPTRGVLAPGTFIPLAEQSGLIHEVTELALTETVRQLAVWRAEGRDLPVAVNLSAHDVATPAVVDTVEDLLATYDLPARLLEVEITETAIVADRSRVVPVLHRLRGLGVRVAIDDFGTGTTSISQLRDLPVDELKIDRLFVQDLGEHAREGSEVVVQAMVDLAHSFSLTVVAEGVEDEATAVVLGRLGVDRAQGFLWARPAPATLVAAGAEPAVPHSSE
ncbi:putative bifunctional diguanylate cyclase/phosphodiesterase [Cellulomonas oligotrophica]|uniref:Diguanylate cyclase (GGDEF)-like protein n=1 Tax=Cellulomonas oligotrophica TaxID=931536 RepID=A0A7Y9JZ10_9CELL|nr:EAL domain-containing protein [Cellulomonas oligotrophica]NYD85700.1 diguanylate cyclase (GGDEF)-like protein [Cellulomonas oligotrophica]